MDPVSSQSSSPQEDPKPPKLPVVNPAWTPEAQAIVQQVPFFARSKARVAVEQWASSEGIELITPEVVRAAQAQFGQ